MADITEAFSPEFKPGQKVDCLKQTLRYQKRAEPPSPIVSVVIPTYNSSQYIVQAIESVLAQTYEDYEIIVIDDGSTDATRAQLQPYQDRITYLYQDNRGSAAARNRGIQTAKGRLVAFLDADDYWLSQNKLAEQVALFAAQPDLGLVNTGWVATDPGGKILFTAKPWHQVPELSLKAWLWHKPVRISAMMIRRDWLYQVGGFDPQFQQSHDVDLVLRLSLMGCQSEWLHQVTTCYRWHQHNTTRNAPKQAECLGQVLDNFFDRSDLPPEIRQAESTVRYHTLVWIAWHQYHLGYEAGMAQYLKQSLSYTPYLHIETVADWITKFTSFSRNWGDELDVSALCSLAAWQHLVLNSALPLRP